MVSSLSFFVACELVQPSIVQQNGVTESHLLLLHWAFLSTSVTICSGSMAERTHLLAYLCYAVVMSGLVYPILADSVWGNGRGLLHEHFHSVISGHSYYDYAGGGVVHLAGGIAALAGNLLLGRRILRPPAKDFCPSNAENAGNDGAEQLKEALQETWQRRFDCTEDDEKEFRPNSYLQVMGVLNLWVGCYGFNASPAFARNDPSSVHSAALSAWNTTLAAAAGASGAFLHLHFFHQNIDMGFLYNGVLSGLVCLTGACDIIAPAGAVLLGFLAGFVVYPLGRAALRRIRVDDPADAIPVHAGNAVFGLIAVAFCHPPCESSGHPFCGAEHRVGSQLVVQLYGVGTIILWTFVVVFPVWAIFVLSESIFSLELEQLAKTYEQAYVDAEAAEALEAGFWASAARSSRITRHLLRQHGWKWAGAPFKDIKDAQDFRQDILEAIHSSKTALEMDFFLVRRLHSMARCLAQCRGFRELAWLRLRIAPFAELSGLGAMAAGKEVAEVVQEVLKVVTDLQDTSSKNMPLELQLDQLSRQVQNQGLLLQRLTRSKRFAGGIGGCQPRLASVSEEAVRAAAQGEQAPAPEALEAPEARPPIPTLPITTSTRGRQLHREEHGDLSMLHARSSTPEDRPLRENTERSIKSATTISDKSMGLITPRSEGDETPPPMVYGHRHHHRNGAVAVMANQLANLLQAQQRFSATLPDIPRQEDFHRQLLLALEHDSRPGSNRSSRTSDFSLNRLSVSSPFTGEEAISGATLPARSGAAV
ncbi:Putative ammonium transporter sll0108 [Durusdinium trenchii]|uniref:Ammonium transporter sll0108 n=2 Tax=Durusdinium trenchii TaxID=1381693 RepID=A0ABP0PXV7_9DINO